MTILVTGGTGTVGSQVVAGLVGKGEQVRCLVRSDEKLKSLPSGVEGRLGDLAKPESLKAAFDGADALFLLTALSESEAEQGLAAVESAKNAGVKKIVHMSVVMPEDSKHIPHFKSKIPIEEAVKASGIAYTILRPNIFNQNDIWFQEAIMSYNVYPQPVGSKTMSRVDVRDIAAAAANALTKPGHDGEEYPLNGPDALSGEDVAAIWSKHLGKTVSYAGDDLDAWAAQAKNMMPGWMVDDLCIMYKYFQETGFAATGDDLAKQKKVLGHDPRSFDKFAQEVAGMWRS